MPKAAVFYWVKLMNYCCLFLILVPSSLPFLHRPQYCIEAKLEVVVFLAKLEVLGFELTETGVDVVAVAGAGLVHALLDAAFGDEGLLEVLQVAVDHGVDLEAEGEADVAELFFVPDLGIGEVVFGVVVLLGEVLHRLEAWMIGLPLAEAVLVQVVAIVLLELADAAARYVQQLQFHLGGCLAILRALDDVLLARTCSLYHLVDSAIAVLRQEALAEDERQLEQRVGLVVEAEVTPVRWLAQHLARVIRDRGHNNRVKGLDDIESYRGG